MLKAIAILSGDVGAKGTIFFEQQALTPDSEPAGAGRAAVLSSAAIGMHSQIVRITGEVRGLPPGKHAMHIHEFGDTTNGCTSAGDHFNPFNKAHGAPDDDIRHVGDLGNIEFGSDGIARILIEDNQISLAPGERCILGRTIVVHDNPDDYGRNGDALSILSGNAGGRACCGVIGMTSAAAAPSTPGSLVELALHQAANAKLAQTLGKNGTAALIADDVDDVEEEEDDDFEGDEEEDDDEEVDGEDDDDDDEEEGDEKGDTEQGSRKRAAPAASNKSSGPAAKAPRRAAQS